MICLVGDILNDVTLATAETKLKMRLGGIVHAAHGLWAIGLDYTIAYFAPLYLDSHSEYRPFSKYIYFSTILVASNEQRRRNHIPASARTACWGRPQAPESSL